MVQEFLSKKYQVSNTKEPGGTNLGSRIRNLLLNTEESLPLKAELLLFFADRNIHIEQKIIPLLEKGELILCDRHLLSTLAYQHNLKGIPFDEVMSLHNYCTNGVIPDLTFVFYGNRLVEDINDKWEERLGDNSHEILNNYYIEYGSKFKNHILVNANRPKEIVFGEIVKEIEKLMG